MAYHRYWKDKPVAFSNSMNLRAYVETFYTKNILLNEGMLRNRPTTRTTHLPGGSATKRQRPLAAKPIHSSLGSTWFFITIHSTINYF